MTVVDQSSVGVPSVMDGALGGTYCCSMLKTKKNWAATDVDTGAVSVPGAAWGPRESALPAPRCVAASAAATV